MITAATMTVGLLGIFTAEQRELVQLQGTLNSAAHQIDMAGDQALSAAQLIAQTSPSKLTVGFWDLNRQFTVISDGELVLPTEWSSASLTRLSHGALKTTSVEHGLVRSVALPDNEWLVLGASTANIDADKSSNLFTLFLITLAANALAVMLVWLLMRGDLKQIRKLIDSAHEIADGKPAQLQLSGGSLEVHSLAAALDRMVANLLASKESMQRFLGDASHELRTPLTVIRGYLELLQSNPQVVGDAGTQRAVGKMLHEAGRMQQLINDLLLLAELGDAGSSTLQLEPVNLSELVLGELESLRDLQTDRQLSVAVPAHIKVTGDRALLTRMLANLFANIRNHTPTDAPVSVHLEPVGGEVHLTLEDGGPGIDLDRFQAEHQVFERFSKARDRASGGSGLGLAIIDGIVTRHNGELRLTKSLDLGGLQTAIKLPRGESNG